MKRVIALLALALATGPIEAAENVTLSESRWIRIENSAMDTVFVPGVDDVFRNAPRSWEMIQRAWSGGVCADDKLYVWGGGHADGAHNGLLSFDVRRERWTRETEPSPIWTVKMCKKGICKSAVGRCAFGKCQAGPDGRPVARHTYNLLASDGNAIYSVGGGIWSKGPSGNANDASTWMFDRSASEWFLLEDSPVSKAHGSLVYARDHLYHMSAGGFAIMDLSTGRWTRPRKGRGDGGQTRLVYVPGYDRIYALGNSRAWYVDRDDFGPRGRTDILGAPRIIKRKYLGVTYYPPADLILIWEAGSKVTTLDPKTHKWGTIKASGTPGEARKTGTFGRFSYCGGRLILANGASNDVYYLDIPGGAPPPTEEPPPPQDPPSPPPPEQNPPPPTPEPPPPTPEPPPPPPTPEPPPPGSDLYPVMATPPGGSLAAFDGWVDDQCGAPRSEWPVINVGPGRDYKTTAAASNAIPPDGIAVVRIHYKNSEYDVLRVKTKRCIEAVGVPGPGGALPKVRGINMTHGLKEYDPIKPGGLIVRGLNVRNASSCIGVPANRRFVAVEDSLVERCGGHAIITDDNADHLYVRLLRNHFRDGGSMHLVYIDRAARADIIDNRCENPGSGHCIRSIAHFSRVEGNTVSNVSLDGTLKEKYNKPGTGKVTVGMHPLEVYICSDGIVKNNTAIKYQRESGAAGVILYRGRTAFHYCDVKGKSADGQWWEGMKATSAEFMKRSTWREIDSDLNAVGPNSRFAFNLVHEGNLTYTIGPRWDIGTHVVSNSGWPSIAAGRERAEIKAAVKALTASFPYNAAAADRLGVAERRAFYVARCRMLSSVAPTIEMKWLFDTVWPENARTVCGKGIIPAYIPRPAPDNWAERQWLTFGRRNRAFEGPTLSELVEVTPVVRLDDKRRVFDHSRPGHYLTHLLNPGGAIVKFDNPEHELP